jgi:hypothetical protein
MSEISGILVALGRDEDGERTIWLRGEKQGYHLPQELFEQAWHLMGTHVALTATANRRLKSIVPTSARY